MPSTSFRGLLRTHSEKLVLGIMTAAVCAVELMWVLRDQSFTSIGDSYLYMARLLSVIDKLSLSSPAQSWSLLGELSVNGRPPLYQVLTAPFIYLLGRSEEAAVSVNLLFLVLLIIATYNMGRLAGSSGKTGLVAALVVCSYPPIAHLSRMYLPHFAVPACAALSLWLLMELTENRSVKKAWIFGASLAFGLMIHPHFAWSLAVPTAIFGVYLACFSSPPRLPKSLRQIPSWLSTKIRDRFLILGLLPGALIVLAVTLPWYLTRGRRLLTQLLFLSSSEVVEYRGVDVRTIGFDGVEPSFWWYLETAPGAISYVFTALAIIGLVAAIITRRAPVLVLPTTLVTAYTLLSTMKLRTWWLFASALPVVAVLAVAWISELRPRWLRVGLNSLCVAVAALSFSLVTWELPDWASSLARALGAPLDSRMCLTNRSLALCPSPPQLEAERWPTTEVIATILDDPECQRRACRLFYVKMGPITYPIFNYLVAKEWPDARLKTVTESSPVSGRPYDFRALLGSQYVFYPDDGWIPAPRGSYRQASIRFLQAPPAAYAEAHEPIASFILPNGKKAALSKRIKPLTTREAEVSIAALDLPEKYKSQATFILARLQAKENRRQKGPGAD